MNSATLSGPVRGDARQQRVGSALMPAASGDGQSAAPSTTIGSDRSWPIDRPMAGVSDITCPSGLPGAMNCGSASRNSSTITRASP